MNKEILLVVEAVSNEKGVAVNDILEAIEAALEIATKKKAGQEIDVKVSINPKTGDYSTVRRWLVVPDAIPAEEFNELIMIRLADAKRQKPTVKENEYITEEMESVEFGRIAAQKAKQVI